MHLPQKKVDGYKMVIDVAVCLTTKEFPILSELGSFKASGDTWMLNNEPKSVHAWVNIDQVQAENTLVRMGFGRKDSKIDEKNGIYYTMKISEQGEGKTAKGNITYIVQAIEIDGKRYNIKSGSKLSNGTDMTTSFTESYDGKSAKNSTLFKFLRKAVNNGFLQFDKVGSHLELMEKKQATPKVEVPKKPRATTKKKEVAN